MYSVREDYHSAWHQFARSYTPQRIANVLTTLTLHRWVRIRYYRNKNLFFVAYKKGDINLHQRVVWVNFEKFRSQCLGEVWLQRKITHKSAEAFSYLFGRKSLKAILRDINRHWSDPDWVIVAYRVQKIAQGKALIRMVV